MARRRAYKRPKKKTVEGTPPGKPIGKVDGIVAEELLPYPIVHYPDHYGIFFAFQKDAQSPLTLCECCRTAVRHYLSIVLKEIESDFADEGIRTDPHDANVTLRKGQLRLDRMFPVALRAQFADRGRTPSMILKKLVFLPNLCHECNGATPSYRYCHEFYGSSFKQNYGWYQEKLALEYGIYSDEVYLPELCPPEIMTLVQVPTVVNGVINQKRYKQLKPGQFRLQREAIDRVIEDIVRQRYGHKRIGDAWTNETILYRIVCGLFPGQEIRRHHRPKFLNGLELDIFLPGLKLGIEYQGIQHYQPVEHWGGAESLTRLQQRDARKRTLCQKQDIMLVYFDFTEGLSDKYVADKLKPFIA